MNASAYELTKVINAADTNPNPTVALAIVVTAREQMLSAVSRTALTSDRPAVRRDKKNDDLILVVVHSLIGMAVEAIRDLIVLFKTSLARNNCASKL